MNILLKVTKYFVLEGINLIIKNSEALDVSFKTELHRNLFNLFRPEDTRFAPRDLDISRQKRAQLLVLYTQISECELLLDEGNYLLMITGKISECISNLTNISNQTDDCESMLVSFLSPFVTNLVGKLKSFALFDVDYAPRVELQEDILEVKEEEAMLHEPIRCLLYYMAMSIAHTEFDLAPAYFKINSKAITEAKEALMVQSYQDCQLALQQLDSTRKEYHRAVEYQVVTHIRLLRAQYTTQKDSFFKLSWINAQMYPDRYLEYMQVAIGEIAENAMAARSKDESLRARCDMQVSRA